jgi:hypothetical protein
MHDSELADVWSAGHSAFVIRQLSVAMVRGPLTGVQFAYLWNRQLEHGEAKAQQIRERTSRGSRGRMRRLRNASCTRLS